MSHSNHDHLPIRSVQNLITLEEVYTSRIFMSDVGYEITEVGAEIAKAQGDLRLHEEMLKSIEAVAAKMSEEKSNDRRLWEARSSRAYTDRVALIRSTLIHLQTLRARKDGLYARKESALINIEIWRTMQANLRALDIQSARDQGREHNGADRYR